MPGSIFMEASAHGRELQLHLLLTIPFHVLHVYCFTMLSAYYTKFYNRRMDKSLLHLPNVFVCVSWKIEIRKIPKLKWSVSRVFSRNNVSFCSTTFNCQINCS